MVRRVSNLARKDAAAGAPSDTDPFADPDPALFVADLSATHFALLNKYNVIERHLLVVTRAAIEQEAPLDAADFEALAQCMEGAQTLGFYNGGGGAGASHRHKHLQVVPLPLAAKGRAIPMEALIEEGAALPFPHALRTLAADFTAADLLDRYLALRHELGTPGAYNLLVTRAWMLMVPRTRPAFEGIDINALGFAGSIFVKDDACMGVLERAGPMELLRAVSAGAAPAQPRGSFRR